SCCPNTASPGTQPNQGRSPRRRLAKLYRPGVSSPQSGWTSAPTDRHEQEEGNQATRADWAVFRVRLGRFKRRQGHHRRAPRNPHEEQQKAPQGQLTGAHKQGRGNPAFFIHAASLTAPTFAPILRKGLAQFRGAAVGAPKL